jgi:bacterial/archaeal transporter family protein
LFCYLLGGIAFSTTTVLVVNLSRRTWIFLTLSGLATRLSWLCYFRALQLGDASRVAPVDKLSVVFVILFATLFLNERLTLQQEFGETLITTIQESSDFHHHQGQPRSDSIF